MDIECQGCYYTVSSFVCLTEDLSEILKFLWRHGCLRKSYSCDKCGRKCAIGDKDLFFRCNRNKLEAKQTDPDREQHYHQQHLEAAKGGLQLDMSGIYFLQDGGIHPALRQPMPLPGDPLPPSHISPVLETIDRKFFLTHGSLIQPAEPNQLRSPQVEDMEHLQGAELADLDAESKQHKRQNGSNALRLKERCNFKVSMKKGTFFEKSKLPIDTVCKFVAFWCCMRHPTQEFLRNELSLAARTVVDWSTTCRDICVHWARANSEKIGGEGVIVQVDEVKIAGGRAQCFENRFSFWGIEKDKDRGRVFVVPVQECDKWNLLAVVKDWVLPGSVVVSSCWRTYDCMESLEFRQETALHCKTFLHPPHHTLNCDVKTEDVMLDAPMPRFGTRRSHHLGDLAEFMFKRRFGNHLERMHAFFRQVAMVYPQQ